MSQTDAVTQYEVRDLSLYPRVIKVSLFLILLGLLYVAGTAMPKAMFQEEPGSMFGFLTHGIIWFLCPLFAIHHSLKKIKTTLRLPLWVVVVGTIIPMLAIFVTDIGKTYNFFAIANENIKQSFTVVEIIYQKRFNVLKNVEMSAMNYSMQERQAIEAIVSARKNYIAAGSLEEKIKSMNGFEHNLKDVVVNLENYPNLKSDAIFMELIRIVSKTEDELAMAKTQLNTKITTFNKYYNAFPYTFVARAGGHVEKTYFDKEQGKDIYDSTSLLRKIETK